MAEDGSIYGFIFERKGNHTMNEESGLHGGSSPSAEDRDTLKRLRKDIERAKGVAEGTIVRFESVTGPAFSTARRRYTFAALFRARRWYLTGDKGYFSGKNDFTHEEFLRVLQRDDVRNVELATAFEAV